MLTQHNANLIFFVSSAKQIAENLKWFTVSGNQRNQFFYVCLQDGRNGKGKQGEKWGVQFIKKNLIDCNGTVDSDWEIGADEC